MEIEDAAPYIGYGIAGEPDYMRNTIFIIIRQEYARL